MRKKVGKAARKYGDPELTRILRFYVYQNGQSDRVIASKSFYDELMRWRRRSQTKGSPA